MFASRDSVFAAPLRCWPRAGTRTKPLPQITTARAPSPSPLPLESDKHWVVSEDREGCDAVRGLGGCARTLNAAGRQRKSLLSREKISIGLRRSLTPAGEVTVKVFTPQLYSNQSCYGNGIQRLPAQLMSQTTPRLPSNWQCRVSLPNYTLENHICTTITWRLPLMWLRWCTTQLLVCTLALCRNDTWMRFLFKNHCCHTTRQGPNASGPGRARAWAAMMAKGCRPSPMAAGGAAPDSELRRQHSTRLELARLSISKVGNTYFCIFCMTFMLTYFAYFCIFVACKCINAQENTCGVTAY